jgi:hypothetical protein
MIKTTRRSEDQKSINIMKKYSVRSQCSSA